MPFNPLSWFSRSIPSLSSSSPSPSPPPTTPLSPPTAPLSTISTTSTTPTTPTIPESIRLRKQLTLLLGGGTFLLLSVAVTRRSLHKRRLGLVPAFYHPNNRPPLVPPNGAMDAIQALNLATLNTLAFAVLLVGGGMFSLDISSMQELRERIHTDEVDKTAQEEFEEWMVGVLARKEMKEEAKKRVEREVGKE